MSDTVRSVRRAFAEVALLLVVVLAVTPTARTLPNTWSFLSQQHDTYARLTDANPNLVPVYDSLLPEPARTFFAQHLKRGDRFYVQARQGPFITGVDYPTAVRTFARYEFLPALEVADPRQADVVLSAGADPSVLGLRYTRIDHAAGGYAAARVQRTR